MDSICGLQGDGGAGDGLPESPPESGGSEALSPPGLGTSPAYYGQSPKQIHQTGGAGPPAQTFPSANQHHQRQQLPGQTAEAVAKYPDLSMVDYTLPLQIIQVISFYQPRSG